MDHLLREPALRSLPWSRRARDLAVRHPYLVVGGVALVVRVAFALVVFSRSGYLIPDEQQYVDLARTVASGHPATDWQGPYGPLLYSNTWAYTGVLRFLFVVLSPSHLVAQLYPAVVGSAVAVLTTALARRLVSLPFAVLAGLTVALLPSQVLWSSVALREANVWFAAAALAVLCAAALDRSRPIDLVPVALGMVLALVAMNHLRNQTLVAALWAVIAAGWFGSRQRGWRAVGGTALGLVLPLALGLGIGGADYVRYGATGLAERRTNLALGAASAVTELHALATTSTLPSSRPVAGGGVGTGAGSPTSTSTSTSTSTTLPPDESIVAGPGGAQYVVDDSSEATLAHAPRGFMAMLVRPLPWEVTDNLGTTMAKFENLLWFALYGLAAAGALRSRRNPAIAFPVVFVGLVVAIGSVSQGNVGTAFRHRAQLLWALAALAAVPVEQLWQRHVARRRADVVAEPDITALGVPASLAVRADPR